MRLALDVGLAGLALRIERVEGEIEIMFGRFARVDRAALALRSGRLHLGTVPGIHEERAARLSPRISGSETMILRRAALRAAVCPANRRSVGRSSACR